MSDTDFTKQVTDKEGLVYDLKVQVMKDVLFIRLIHAGQEVGEVRCVRDGASLLLGDITVKASEDEGLWSSLSRRIKGQLKNYQQRGLGTILLKQLVEIAKELGVQQIYGPITARDLDANPALLKWYEQQGFQVSSFTQEDIENAIARVSINLKKEQD